MELTDQHVEQIRDYVGTAEPADNTLYEYAETATYWQEVALRVLRRRRTEAASGGSEVKNFTLSGVLSVGRSETNFSALDRLIADLEAQIAALNGETSGVTVSVLRRPGRYR